VYFCSRNKAKDHNCLEVEQGLNMDSNGHGTAYERSLQATIEELEAQVQQYEDDLVNVRAPPSSQRKGTAEP
jgi:hypothetical protein